MALGDRYYSVEVPRDNVLDVDGDYYRPQYTLHRKVKDWADDYDIDLDWSFDDLGNVWFEFDNRGVAAIFLLNWA
jgi:hypothetical protein